MNEEKVIVHFHKKNGWFKGDWKFKASDKWNKLKSFRNEQDFKEHAFEVIPSNIVIFMEF